MTWSMPGELGALLFTASRWAKYRRDRFLPEAAFAFVTTAAAPVGRGLVAGGIYRDHIVPAWRVMDRDLRREALPAARPRPKNIAMVEIRMSTLRIATFASKSRAGAPLCGFSHVRAAALAT
jgi:hypothetical protein